jgi:hypothetical protein
MALVSIYHRWQTGNMADLYAQGVLSYKWRKSASFKITDVRMVIKYEWLEQAKFLILTGKLN